MNKVKNFLIKNKWELFFLVILGVISFFLRFTDLGFHHYYGDEIKTLFLRKDESAIDFLMDQRKGPIQFLIVWFVEKISGTFEESLIRLPFAIFGFLLVFVFYYFLRFTLGYNSFISLFAAFLVSLNGIYIAFSRTAQYQMVYMVFGFLMLIFFHKFLETKIKRDKIIYFFLAFLFLTLGLLTHYDVLFFLLPLFLIFKEYKKSIILVIVSFISSLIFYGPQVYYGFFSENTTNYLIKRVTGEKYLPTYTPYTLGLYNPLFLYFVVLIVFSLYGYWKSGSKERSVYFNWFFWPFLLLDFFVLVPGTHVHNYLLPLFILAGLGFDYLRKDIKQSWLLFSFVILLFVSIFMIQSQVFLPKFNTGYPFTNSTIFGFQMNALNKNYSTPIYGFVYNRSWYEISEYMNAQKRVQNFATNENKVVSEYFLFGYFFTDWDPKKPAEYYIEVNNSQEVDKFVPVDITRYELIKTGNDYKIYKIIN